MSFKKAKELLDDGKITKEVFDMLDSEFSTVVGGLNGENKALRVEKENLAKSYDDTIKLKDGLESQITKLDEKIKQAKQDGKNEIATQLETERQEKQTLQENIEKLKGANTKLTLDTALNAEMRKYQLSATAMKVVPQFLRGGVSMGEDGKPMFGGDSDFSVAIKKYFDENQDFLAPTGVGSGSGVNGGGGGTAKGNFAGDASARENAIKAMMAKEK
jgi:hypothetical protein